MTYGSCVLYKVKQWTTNLGFALTSEYFPRKIALEFLKNEQELIVWRRKEIREDNKDRGSAWTKK